VRLGLGTAAHNIRGDETVCGIVIRRAAEPEKRAGPARRVLIAIGLHANVAVAADPVRVSDRGEVIIGPNCSASFADLFAASAVTEARGKRIIVGADEKVKATPMAKQYLIGRC